MTKPPLGKVEALLYVLQHVTQKRMCQNYDTPSNPQLITPDYRSLHFSCVVNVWKTDGCYVCFCNVL